MPCVSVVGGLNELGVMGISWVAHVVIVVWEMPGSRSLKKPFLNMPSGHSYANNFSGETCERPASSHNVVRLSLPVISTRSAQVRLFEPHFHTINCLGSTPLAKP